MSSPLVECIPNFSEARRPEVVEAILSAIRSVPGVRLLDHHSDLDHNRTVVTYLGAPAAVEEAAFRAIALAAERINLDEHTGEHPRMGATDVVPFVPIRDVSMTECVEMARRLGKRVGAELQIPVYFYEEAAVRPERKNLEDVRRGQYEALKLEIGVKPERDPDFGPRRLTPAGATIIGARQPLVAFNVYLTTDDVSIAQRIAKAVRNSSGGLRYVKALGLLVEGRAQVSMNLTNFHQTPIARVVEFVRREAARYGVGVRSSELVGLVPQEALVDAAVWYTQLDGFTSEQILEHRLNADASQTDGQAASEMDAQPDAFLSALAGATAAPGGGAAAAYAAGMSAALAAMVARLTVGKKKYAAVEAPMWQIIEQADDLRKQCESAVTTDAAAFEEYLRAVRLPKETPEQQAIRAEKLHAATLQTIAIPLYVAGMAVTCMRLGLQAAELGNLNALSDAASGVALAQAALTAAGLNVRINCPNLPDPAEAQPALDELRALNAQAAQLQAALAGVITTRGVLAEGG